jgi:diguanylate cyclase (GGDEF)-like protein
LARTQGQPETITQASPNWRSKLARTLATDARTRRIWGLTFAIFATAAVLYAGPVAGLGPLAKLHLPWWLLFLGYVVGERCVVYLNFGRHGQMFSLGDIVTVFGLMFCGGHAVVLAGVLGSAAVLGLHHRQRPTRLGFNLAEYALRSGIAVVLVHALMPAGGGTGPLTWLAVWIAVQVGGIVSTILVASVISIADKPVRLRQLGQMLCTDVLIISSNVGLGLCAAALAANDPSSLPLLLVPCGMLYGAYRAYLSERERHARLEFLYEANRALARSREIGPALEELLERSLDAFRAEQAEIVLFGSEEHPSLRTLLHTDGRRLVMERLEREAAEELTVVLQEPTGGAFRLKPPFPGHLVRNELDTRGVRNAILAPLPGEDRPIGLIMVANRRTHPTSFRKDDLRLLDTLASNASVALQWDRSERVVSQLRSVQDRLHHEAHHDPLTALANRRLFADKVAAALEDEANDVGILFIDLDNFKTVNDRLGHHAGDELLVCAASRLRACRRAGDVVARLGGDEFAVLVQDRHDAECVALDVADRIMESFAAPVRLEGEVVQLRLSVGIATRRHRRTAAAELLREADVAMYQAKTSGKSQYQLFRPAAVQVAPAA